MARGLMRIDRDGVSISFEVVGRGFPLLLYSGAGADSDIWRAVGYVDELSRDFTCVLIEPEASGEATG